MLSRGTFIIIETWNHRHAQHDRRPHLVTDMALLDILAATPQDTSFLQLMEELEYSCAQARCGSTLDRAAFSHVHTARRVEDHANAWGKPNMEHVLDADGASHGSILECHGRDMPTSVDGALDHVDAIS